MAQQASTSSGTKRSPAPAPGRGQAWAAGGTLFAGVLLLVDGILGILNGIAGIAADDVYTRIGSYVFEWDLTAWGWIHLIIGILLVITGTGLLARQTWAGVTAIFLAMLSAVANFFFIPYYPFWSILVIALDVWVIWALTRPGAIET
jgi:hypothetical protein